MLDTPEKSRNPPPPSAYGERSCLSDCDLSLIEMAIDDILTQAEIWRSQGVPEPHWCDQVVSPLLNLTRRLDCAVGGQTPLKPAARTLNM